jgi:hypothetical protein
MRKHHHHTTQKLLIPMSEFTTTNHLRRWCSGNMKPFQGLASGSIPERRINFFLLKVVVAVFVVNFENGGERRRGLDSHRF